MAETTLLGAEVGGIFTDLVLVDEASGAVLMAKVPTTVANQVAGVVLTASDPPTVDRRATDKLRRWGCR